MTALGMCCGDGIVSCWFSMLRQLSSSFSEGKGGPPKVRCGPTTLLQPRLPSHGLHCLFSSSQGRGINDQSQGRGGGLHPLWSCVENPCTGGTKWGSRFPPGLTFPPPTPYESISKSASFDVNNTDKGVVCACHGNTQPVTIAS
jgi:hypothetical protein